MSNLSFLQLLNANGYSQLNLGTALANSTSLTDISPGANTAGQAFQFNADTLQVGQSFIIRANGIVSTTGTPNLTLGLYYGGVAGVALATTGAIATASGLSNQTWKLEADLRVDGVGTSGAIRTIGSVSGAYSSPALMPASSSSANSVTVDTSSTKLLTLGAIWGTASASNSIQVAQFYVLYLTQGIS